MTTRTVISTSKKTRAVSPSGRRMKTQMVIYKTKLPNGKFQSKTKHELKND